MRRHTAPLACSTKTRLLTVFHAVLLAGIEALMRAINLIFFATSAGEKAGLNFTQKGFSFCCRKFWVETTLQIYLADMLFFFMFLVGLSVETLEKFGLVFLFPPCFVFFGCPMGVQSQSMEPTPKTDDVKISLVGGFNIQPL